MDPATVSRDVKEPSNVVLLASTNPAANAQLHEALALGQAVRSYAAVYFQGSAPLFRDVRSVPAAVPPLPNAGGVRGGRPSYAAKQGGTDFMFDYGFAFSLQPAGAFARGGFGSTCIGRTCSGKGAVYTRGSEPFVWERKRNRGGALICRGGGGHLLCLRCVEAEYEAGRPFVSSASGCPVPQQELFTKYETFHGTKELREVQSGEEASEGGHQFFVQRRDLAACPFCRESRTAAPLKRGVKRALDEGPSPRELGSVALLSELTRSKIPPIAVAPGLFLVSLLDASSGRLLDISATDRGLSNVPRLVKVDHTVSFQCLCGQKACRDHEMGFLEGTRSMGGWWQGGEAIFTAFDGSRPFVREVTSGVSWVLPIDQSGLVGAVLRGFTDTTEMSFYFDDVYFDELDVSVISEKQALNMLYSILVRGSWGKAGRISDLRCFNEDAPGGNSDEDPNSSETSDCEDQVDYDMRPDSEMVKDFFPDSRTLDAFVSMMTLYKKDLETFCAEYKQTRVLARADCAHLYSSEVEAAETEARSAGTPLRQERTEGAKSELATYAFGRDKVVTFDGTFFANSSAMRDSQTEASLHSVCEPDPEASRVAGGFTPLSVGGVRPSVVPSEGIDCEWKYRNGLSELRPAVRALAQRWCNFRKAQAQGSNAPLKPEEFVAMREGLPANVRALIDFVTESGVGCADPTACAVCKGIPRRPWMQGHLKDGRVGATGWCPNHWQPYGALLHALLIPRYSWVFGHVVGLKLLRHLLLEGPLDERGMAYLSEDAPMLATILRLHPVAGGLYICPPTLRPLLRDIYATNLLCFEPSANRPTSSPRSPLAALHDATEHLWTIEGEKLRLVGQPEPAAMGYAERHAAALKRVANSLLFELETREPQCYGEGGFLSAPSVAYAERVQAVSSYDFHPLLYGRPQFLDWEDGTGRGKKGSEERLTQHCSAPNPRSSKGRAGVFIACCQDRAPLGYHWLKGGESVSDLGTVLLTRFPFKALRGLTIVEDAACNAQEWFLNRVPQIAKFMLFVVDRFHSGPISCAPSGAKRYATHTCSPTLFIDSFPQHAQTITTASEGINSGLKRCAPSLQQITSIKRLLSRVTTILDTLFERSKYAVYWSKASNPLRDSIKRGRC
ncbi:hypothetical protein KFL_006400060 [Klebsormidium nitens]|uniref:HMG domain-containing protein n=1 Tax=Klebsormidium nitens TaxID=105231 RepID=A0A1Y1IHU3_KLENI|nr:hypothetical protein KFL_006400060 [Klebsormidium nitens]|eukprot:GAQ90450.1 hypothetical protein KFL_006400060 [Klebsormidium nitens]